MLRIKNRLDFGLVTGMLNGHNAVIAVGLQSVDLLDSIATAADVNGFYVQQHFVIFGREL